VFFLGGNLETEADGVRAPEELANYLDPIAKHLAEQVNEISDYLRTELLNE
jgi:hypothetical protein